MFVYYWYFLCLLGKMLLGKKFTFKPLLILMCLNALMNVNEKRVYFICIYVPDLSISSKYPH